MNLSAMLRMFSIRTRMIGAIAMVLTLLVIVGGVGLYGMNSLRGQSKQLADKSVVDAKHMTLMVQAMGNLRRFEKDMVITHAQPDEVKSYHQKWVEARKALEENTKALMVGHDDANNRVMGQIMPLMTDYVAKAQPVLAQLETGSVSSAAEANNALKAAKDHAQEAEKLLNELRQSLEQDTAKSLQASESTQSTVFTVFIAVLILSSVIVVPLTLLNMQSICTPLAEAGALADAIAKGDLTMSAQEVVGQDEASHLMNSLQNMQQALQSLVGHLRISADSIRTASVEIATGNQDLSGRTEQTASNLQQAASSMVQLTGTVKQTADSARTANQLANSASGAAAKGGEVVGQVVATMDEINASSKKISDIIGVIDGIAFQTNILALNAAVEAARAGEQGRGFAVVASEVRSLAQRSAEAAREIKTLIGASVERVETGSRLVQEAGSSMTDIVTSVQRVSDIIGEISAAASEQSDGIGQVNQSVVQLDQMTQQNAALVEESAAAAESLKDQAERLAEAVDRFKVNADAKPGSATGFGAGKSLGSVKSSGNKPAASSSGGSLGARSGASSSHHGAHASSKTAASPRPATSATSTAPASVRAPAPARAPAPQPAQAEGDWESF
ncbi:methyl-accepting chemotaxis protein [Paucibacter aquatile]|uniref:Methyl-accepting chemotaxis protein n=1 Tax=Kinneretia aquatilis TaxID=2070761 RepID=A0A2N8KV79_9BURK|nr:methyl-accepting chemotaxis protein [Paucibacter aquatile]PND37367.1 methyl-accepting chemotaxis protein [Paucibacter aquatile]